MRLPSVIEDIVRLIGHGKAMQLVAEFGGQDLRIPKTDQSDTWAAIEEVIGAEAMKILAAEYGGTEPVYIAMCFKAMKADRNRRMITRYDSLIKEGHTGRGAVSVIVREFRPISYRQVETIINAPTPGPSAMIEQAQLF
ncbi:hypothetical protein [Propionivibrio dicarboxylicus]|uniref:Uncharacterized protein n=1 Tax=Propionivibrio dicarboxylicus TaxID=83767 RepID=A0A1G8LAQ4_9RHOO|nr:hypothetical protein [Propionivibrio dicarboxylicus]SDI52683.1 hypothetical protein SAMN05660652_03587 [Propionivibrio dicarboxylicus]